MPIKQGWRHEFEGGGGVNALDGQYSKKTNIWKGGGAWPSPPAPMVAPSLQSNASTNHGKRGVVHQTLKQMGLAGHQLIYQYLSSLEY